MREVLEPGAGPAKVPPSIQETIFDRGRSRPEPAEIRRGATIGRYHVLGRIGSGAMGIVHEAYDPDLDRKVALKVIRFAGEADRDAEEAHARLHREAQALAQLNHPNVVIVHDVGRVGGTLFIAMELVAGRTLGAWRQAAPRGWREIVAVFDAAGRGLAAAHAAGLVHRDFKPDNVMITPPGVPGEHRVRVMDFGLALVGDRSASMAAPIAVGWDPAESIASGETLTRDGITPGTPAYMSPEQRLGSEVDARSDQFAFCVALFEALYGYRPFAGETTAALAVAVFEGAIVARPTDTAVPRWIHAVVLRGLAVDPVDRFAGMDELLAELRRDPTRRRRIALATVAAAATAVAILGVRELGARRQASACEAAGETITQVWSAAKGGAVEQSLLDTGVAHAATAWARIGPRLDDYAQKWKHLRTDACRRAEVTHEWSADQLARAAACFDERSARLQGLLDVLQDADRAVVFESVGAVAELPGLEPCLDDAALRRREPPSSDPAEQQWHDHVRRRLQKVEAFSSSGRYRAARDAANEIFDDVHESGADRLEIETLLTLGELDYLVDDKAAARAHLEAAYFGAERLGLDEPAAEAAIHLVNVVGRSFAEGDEGLQWARHAEGALARIPDADGLAIARLLEARGLLQIERREYEASLADQHRALALRRAALSEDHPLVAQSITSIGSAYFEMERFDEAFRSLEEVLAISESAYGPDHPRVSEALNNLGVGRSRAGDHDGARTYLERSLAIRLRTFGEDHSLVANTLTNLGDAAFARRDYAGAVELHRRAVAIRERVGAADHPLLALSLNNLGMALQAAGDYRAAVAALSRAVEIASAQLGPSHPNVTSARWGIGGALVMAGDYAQGRQVFDDVFELGPRERTAARIRDYVKLLWPVLPAERARLEALARDTLARRQSFGPEDAAALAKLEQWSAKHGGEPRRRAR